MSGALPSLAAAAPVAAGWTLHSLWMRRRITAARCDPLTGLPTRAGFERRAARLLRRGGPCAVAVIDLNGFKHINDTFGHATGDLVIQGAGHGLAEWNHDGAHGVVARVGGDEFAAVFPETGPDGARLALGGLHGLLTAPLWCDGRTVGVGASVGAVWHPCPAPADLPVLLRRADEAMYAAKRHGGGVRLADDAPGPGRATVNGRRAGRPGTHLPPAVPAAPEGTSR
ncbi:GGDEF domain-containing protein [Streptomyces sp. B1866]|uniref:GGDEF domain-containing protein n=1 Tax=Streptomyces sp. B1866 TaxID=3075431 RepID=UPI00288D3FA5|nr:GGDEF domain-containing protein [Streptomyces sp. B1866]MDT3396145.1 GGDEF domain-containing protein [Streptomyces sp. B1866]